MIKGKGFKFMEGGRSGRPAPWLVSFGDLLTLLLCFVLSLVCYGHFGPNPDTDASPRKSTAGEAQGGLEEPSREIGTPLAPSLRGEHPRDGALTLFFGELDFQSGDGLSGEADRRLSGFLGASHRGTVTVEACSGRADGDPWFSSVGRALVLRQRVLRTGLRNERLRTRVSGRHCSDLRAWKGAPPDAIAGLILQADEGNG